MAPKRGTQPLRDWRRRAPVSVSMDGIHLSNVRVSFLTYTFSYMPKCYFLAPIDPFGLFWAQNRSEVISEPRIPGITRLACFEAVFFLLGKCAKYVPHICRAHYAPGQIGMLYNRRVWPILWLFVAVWKPRTSQKTSRRARTAKSMCHGNKACGIRIKNQVQWTASDSKRTSNGTKLALNLASKSQTATCPSTGY